MGVLDYKRDTTVQDQLPAFLKALAQRESGGQKDPYKAIGKKTKAGDFAYGKYQIMGANIPSWTKQYLGKSMTPEEFMSNPQAQDQLMAKRATELYAKHGSWEDVASIHFTGQTAAAAGSEVKDVNGTSNGSYISDIMGFFNKMLGGGTAEAATVGPGDTSIGTSTGKMSVSDFAAKIKAKYPAYSSMDDASLAQKIIAKYPQYQSQVDMGTIPSPVDAGAGGSSGGNPVVNAVKATGSALGGMFKDDFTGLGNMLRAVRPVTAGVMQGKGVQYPGGETQAWQDLGGGIGAISDIAMGLGMIAGDVGTGGAGTAADPAEAAGYIAARKGAGTAVRALGTFAAGRGAGNVAQGISSGVSTAAKAKGQGKSTAVATGEGIASGALSMATFGVMNKFGPSVANGFIGLVSKLKVGPFVQGMLDKVTTTLTNAAQSGAMKAAGSYAKTALNSAAAGIVKMNSTIFKAMSDNLKAPTNEEVTALANRVQQNVGVRGNARVAQLFESAKQKLAPFVVSIGDISKIVGEQVVSATKSTMSVAEFNAMSAKDAASAEAESALERVKTLIEGKDTAGNISVQDLLSEMNIAPKAAQESKAMSDLWSAIRDAVGNDPIGKAALSDYENARSARMAQNIQSDMAGSMEKSAANPVVGQTGQGQNTWHNFVSNIWDKLSTPTDVQHLEAAFGSPIDMQSFSKMLGKKILFDGMNAYRVAAGSITHATPETAKAAATAFQKKITEYTDKLAKLPGIMDPETIHFFQDMAHGIPDVETIAKNAGVDATKMVDEAGKPLLQIEQDAKAGLALSTEEMKTVSESPVGKFLAKAGTDFRGLPDALLKSSSDSLNLLKKTMAPEHWDMMGALTTGKILQTVNGLWGETDRVAIEKTLDTISAKAGGDRSVFEAIFGKKEGTSILNDLVKYGNALSESGGKFTSVAKNAASAAVFSLIHHYYIAAILANKAVKDVLSTEDSAFLSKVASMSKTQLNAEFRKAAGEVGGVPGLIVKFTNLLNSTLAPIFKYEVGNKLPQTGVQSATDLVSGDTSASPPSGEGQ